MDRLIQDVLVYNRLSRREVSMRPANLDKLIREIVDQYPEMHVPRAEMSVDPNLGIVMAHEPSLLQALTNLLSNAVKFVPENTIPRVRIYSEKRGAELRLWIQDNGIGVKPEHQRRVFGLFERIHPENKYEGTGIGLAIVRRALERMNGTVGVESDGVHGSKFYIQLAAA